jgi:hypothetical protein
MPSGSFVAMHFAAGKRNTIAEARPQRQFHLPSRVNCADEK